MIGERRSCSGYVSGTSHRGTFCFILLASQDLTNRQWQDIDRPSVRTCSREDSPSWKPQKTRFGSLAQENEMGTADVMQLNRLICTRIALMETPRLPPNELSRTETVSTTARRFHYVSPVDVFLLVTMEFEHQMRSMSRYDRAACCLRGELRRHPLSLELKLLNRISIQCK